MIDCEFDTLILSLVLIWIFYVFNFILQLSKKKELTPEQARILELEKQLRYAQIENAYLKELRRLRLEDARKMKEQQESLAVSEENSN